MCVCVRVWPRRKGDGGFKCVRACVAEAVGGVGGMQVGKGSSITVSVIVSLS